MGSTCDHDHGSTAGLAGAALAAELSAAQARCETRGQRLTDPRRRVLELLLGSGQPIKAYDLMAAYEVGAPAKPPTVYRALDFLEREGFVHRIESLNAFIACRAGLDDGQRRPHAATFLICDCCGAAQEAAPLDEKVVADLAAGAGYVVRALTVEAHGLCADCRAA